MSKKLMLIFISLLLFVISVGAIHASDINDTSMGIQTSDDDFDVLNSLETYDVSNSNLSVEDNSDAYGENTVLDSDDVSSDSNDTSAPACGLLLPLPLLLWSLYKPSGTSVPGSPSWHPVCPETGGYPASRCC